MIEHEILKGETNKYGYPRNENEGALANLVEKTPVEIHTMLKMAIGQSKGIYSKKLAEYNLWFGNNDPTDEKNQKLCEDNAKCIRLIKKK